MKRFCAIYTILCLAVCTAFADVDKVEKLQAEVQKLNEQISKLQKTVEFQRAEIERLKALCTENGIDISPKEKADKSTTAKKNWKVVNHFGKITTVYIAKNASQDKYLIAQILHYIEGRYGKGAVWFFDNMECTPLGVPMTHRQMLHQIGLYDPAQFKTFQYIKTTNPNSFPPEQKLINTSILPGYAE